MVSGSTKLSFPRHKIMHLYQESHFSAGCMHAAKAHGGRSFLTVKCNLAEAASEIFVIQKTDKTPSLSI